MCGFYYIFLSVHVSATIVFLRCYSNYLTIARFSIPYFYRPQRSWGKVIFSEACVKNSVHMGRGVVVSQHALQVSRPTPSGKLRGLALGVPGPHQGGGKLRGLAWGASRPTPRGVSEHALRQTPPPHS